MTYKILNGETGEIRDCTPEEATEIEARLNAMPTEDEYVDAVQSMLDTKVKERRYDNIISACTYATCAVPPFAAEGQACVAWRGAVWSKAYELLGQVEHGVIPQPTVPELLAMLPQLVWPT